MDILFVQKEGTDLHSTLFSSETSRDILRFYRPRRLDYGVSVTCATLGSALALVSELKWYVRRYVSSVIFEIEEGIYCTRAYAIDLYEHEENLHNTWAFCHMIGIRDGYEARMIIPEPGQRAEDYPEFCDSVDTVLTVRCSEDEISEDQ